MAALFWGKRITINISKTSSKDFPNHYFHSASRISRSRWLSSAYEHAHGSNAVAESTDHKAGTEASRDGLYEAKQEALDEDEGRPSGVTGFVADKVKDGARKAVDTAENVGDTAKQIMDGAWKAAKETTEKIKDNVICGDDGDRDHDHIHRDPSVFDAKKTSDPIDTQEYRSIEDQRNKADTTEINYLSSTYK
ncbi:uncharacterized protein LOC18054084 [Citrus clementina]|uniref:uncharacterized protein LOC18054084 n=1 Tax=Citrus clementina TaxID=85681 RepID=UPI000CED0F04|nr:uncharacterized protein LOC18054084 [Citrus x clementina]